MIGHVHVQRRHRMEISEYNIMFSRPAELRVSGEEITVSLRFGKSNPLDYGGSESVGKPRINELYAPPAARIGAY